MTKRAARKNYFADSMNESKWMSCVEPNEMLFYLRSAGENRKKCGRKKLRIFGCYCARRVEGWMSARGRCWVEMGEKLIDGHRTTGEYDPDEPDFSWFEFHSARRVETSADNAGRLTASRNILVAAMGAAGGALSAIASNAELHHKDVDSLIAAERIVQADLLRDIFGNPFRPSTIASEWLTWNNATVPKLAQTIYDDRRYDIMPILGDALEDAGCTDAQILDHCRGPGPHVRGCWVVDLILGKEQGSLAII